MTTRASGSNHEGNQTPVAPPRPSTSRKRGSGERIENVPPTPIVKKISVSIITAQRGKKDGNDDGEPVPGTSRETEMQDPIKSTLDMLECPVCMEYPKTRPIYTCTNGHVLCSFCRAKSVIDQNGFPNCKECLKECYHCSHGNPAFCKKGCRDCRGTCPICSDHKLTPDFFVGRLADKLLKNIIIKCQFSIYGCIISREAAEIAEHQTRCAYREISCPARHRGACGWSGSLSKLLTHAKRDVNKDLCIHISKIDDDSKPFTSSCGDFVNEPSIFTFRNQWVEWKPVLLISQLVTNYLIYVTVKRSPQGLWFFQARTYSPDAVMEGVKIKIEAYKMGSNDMNDRYAYYGEIIPDTMTNDEGIATGKSLTLTDSQIKRISAGRALCAWDVRIIINQVPSVSAPASPPRGTPPTTRSSTVASPSTLGPPPMVVRAPFPNRK